MSLTCSQAEKELCRNGCCRKFAGIAFCDMESNCIDNPTWIVILVPVLLGLAAIALIAVVLVRLKTRKVIDHYEFIRQQTEKQFTIKNNQQTQRQLTSGMKQL